MADPLKTLSGLISVGTGVSSLLSNNSRDQYRYQLSLNRQQQQFARENRAAELRNQYQYQYNLPLLNKAGLQAAGFSVAGVEDGNVSAANTPGTASPSAGSAPTGAADVQAKLGVANLLQQLSLVQAQTEKTRQEAEGQKIQNDINSKSADWTVMLNESQARSAKIKALTDEKYGDRKEHAATVTAEIEAQLKQYEFETGTQLTNLQIDAARKNLDILDIQADNLKKAGAISDITYQKIKQDIAESRARVSNLDVDTEGKRLFNDVSEKLQPYQVANMIKDAKLRSLILDNDLVDQSLRIKYGSDWRTKLMRQIEQHQSDMKSHGWNSNDWFNSSFKHFLFDITDLLNGSLGSLVQSIGK